MHANQGQLNKQSTTTTVVHCGPCNDCLPHTADPLCRVPFIPGGSSFSLSLRSSSPSSSPQLYILFNCVSQLVLLFLELSKSKECHFVRCKQRQIEKTKQNRENNKTTEKNDLPTVVLTHRCGCGQTHAARGRAFTLTPSLPGTRSLSNAVRPHSTSHCSLTFDPLRFHVLLPTEEERRSFFGRGPIRTLSPEKRAASQSSPPSLHSSSSCCPSRSTAHMVFLVFFLRAVLPLPPPPTRGPRPCRPGWAP